MSSAFVLGISANTLFNGHSWLQEVFNVPLVVMLSDDEKFFHSTQIEIDSVRRFTKANIADIIALGFDMKKTFIFSNLDFVSGAFYENICRMAKKITLNSVKSTFGFGDRYVPCSHSLFSLFQQCRSPC